MNTSGEITYVENEKLFNSNFLIMVVGQLISLLGNSILRFALPLYILEKSHSQALFGTVLAIATIPTILISPIGGLIADRVNKRNIMVFLDFITSAIVAIYLLSMSNKNLQNNEIIIIAVVLTILSMIQSLYQPAVQASIPVVSSQENLLKCNSVVNLVTSMSNLLGPILGGMLFGYFGIKIIIISSAVCFFLSAILEIFLKIPFFKPESQGNIFKIASSDIKESVKFAVNDKPVIMKTTLLIAFFNMFLGALITVGIPVIVTVNLKISSQLYGFTQAAMGVGGLMGGILAGTLFSKLKINKYYLTLLFTSVFILPIGLSTMINDKVFLSYCIITASCFLYTACATVFSIATISFIQRETPNHLIGKVMSFVLAGSMCSQPIGQIAYGFLFKNLNSQIHLIIFTAVSIGIAISLWYKSLISKQY